MKIKFNFFDNSILILIFGLIIFGSCKNDDDDNSSTGYLYPKKITLLRHTAPQNINEDSISTSFIYNGNKTVDKFITISTQSGKADTLESRFIYNSMLDKETLFKITGGKTIAISSFNYDYYPSSPLAGLLKTRIQKEGAGETITNTESFLYNSTKTLKEYKKLNDGTLEKDDQIDQKVHFNYVENDLHISTLVDTTKIATVTTINKVTSIVYSDYTNPFFNKVNSVSLANMYGDSRIKINVIMAFFNKMPKVIISEYRATISTKPITVTTTFEGYKLLEGLPIYFEVYKKIGDAPKTLFETYKVEYQRM